MQKTTKKLIVAILMFSMVTMYGTMPAANAASFDSLNDTISDSDISATGVTHTIVLQSHEDLDDGTDIVYDFEGGIDLTGAAAVCPAGAGVAGVIALQTVTCTISGADLTAATDHTLTVTDAVNPGSTDSYSVTVTATNVSAITEESVTMIYIIDDVEMTAHVDATLTFAIVAVTDGTPINGTNTTIASTNDTIPFGTLASGTAAIIGQELNVTTNAGSGFIVTVQQNDELTNAAGDDIDPADVAMANWTAPSSDINDATTFGKMGFTSSDISIDGAEFGANNYRGFSGTTPVGVMYHDGPADGSTDHIGSTNVAFQVEIGDMQEAGDYESSITYVCTPTF